MFLDLSYKRHHMNMNQHGNLHLSWQGPILIAEATGLFNKEGMLEARSEIEAWVYEYQKDHPQGNWARLESVSDISIPTPEAKSILEEIYTWGDNNGCVAVAVASIHHQMFKNIFQSESNIQYFEKEEDAKTWLLTQLPTEPK